MWQILSILRGGTYFEQFFDVIASTQIVQKTFFSINAFFRLIDHFIHAFFLIFDLSFCTILAFFASFRRF